MPCRTLSILSSIALLTLGGCGGLMGKDEAAKALEATLATYGEAMRWGRFETAYGHVRPAKRRQSPEYIDNLRIIGYEVLEPPLMRDEKSAEQVVRIRYVHEDRQLLRSLLDRQRWVYDQTIKGWCQIPCDYIPSKSYPLFRANEVLRLLIGEITEDSEASEQAGV